MSTESVEVLRERLNHMKRMMAERHGTASTSNGSASPTGGKTSQQSSIEDLWTKTHNHHPGIIDGNFLSFALCGALVVISTVAIYAFYSLYHAVLKKFPSTHTEL